MSVHRVVLAAFAASIVAAPSFAAPVKSSASSKKSPENTADHAMQMSCIQAMVNGAIGSMDGKYWVQSDDQKHRAYTAQAIEILNKNKQFNKDMGRFCYQLQVAAKKAAATK